MGFSVGFFIANPACMLVTLLWTSVTKFLMSLAAETSSRWLASTAFTSSRRMVSRGGRADPAPDTCCNKKMTCYEDPAVLRIRIHRIHMFLGLPDPDPDPLARGMDPDAKIIRKTLIPTILRLFLTFYL